MRRPRRQRSVQPANQTRLTPAACDYQQLEPRTVAGSLLTALVWPGDLANEVSSNTSLDSASVTDSSHFSSSHQASSEPARANRENSTTRLQAGRSALPAQLAVSFSSETPRLNHFFSPTGNTPISTVRFGGSGDLFHQTFAATALPAASFGQRASTDLARTNNHLAQTNSALTRNNLDLKPLTSFPSSGFHFLESPANDPTADLARQDTTKTTNFTIATTSAALAFQLVPTTSLAPTLPPAELSSTGFGPARHSAHDSSGQFSSGGSRIPASDAAQSLSLAPWLWAQRAPRDHTIPGPDNIGEFPGSGWLKTVFDGSINSSPGLTVTFDRDLAIETYQSSWGVDQPRFRDPIGVQAYRETSLLLPSQNELDFLGSGWSLDGTQPVISVYDRSSRELSWYQGDSFDLIRTQSLGSQVDLLGNAISGKNYRPHAGIFHEGLHVVLTSRWDIATQRVDGLAFFYTQDFGQTWTEVPNLVPSSIPGIASQFNAIGMERGARWAFSNAYPHRTADSQIAAWFPWADYLRKSDNPKGGQVGLFLAERQTVGETWTVRPNRVLWDRWDLLDSGGLHAHGLTIHPDAGVALSWWGDVGYRNEIVAHRFTDLENYETSPLQLIRGAYGGYSPIPNAYAYSNQSAGFAPGPFYGSALAAADENPERITLVSYNTQTNQVQLKPLYSSATNQPSGAGYSNRLSLWIHHLRGVGYVAREIGAVSTGNDNRTWVSEDGLVWTKLQAKSGGSPIIYGQQILFSGEQTDGIRARPWESVQAVSPLLVSPGGTNRQATSLPQRTAPGAGANVRELYIDGQGLLRYVVGNALVTPQPEALPPVTTGAPIYELSITDNRSLGTRWLTPENQTVPLNERQFWQGWVYPLESRGLRTTYRLGGAGSNNQTTERGTDMMANGQWMPTYHTGNPNVNTPTRGYLSMFQMNPGSNRWLLASQSLTAGALPTYPLAPQQSGPHELVTIGGFNSRFSWSSFLSFGLPSVGFDAWGNFGDGPLTVATLWANANNHAQLRYHGATRQLELLVTVAGVTAGSQMIDNVWLSKEDRVDVVISANRTRTELTVALPQDGAQPLMQSISVSASLPGPKEIRLSNAQQTAVAPLEWYAAHFHPLLYRDAAGRVELLQQDSWWQI